jgi:glycosyltransferase involved in cell wall biosynthesis
MRICFANPYFYPHPGGIEARILEVGKRLLSRGHEVFVLTSQLDHSPVREDFHGLNVVRVPSRMVVPYNPPTMLVKGGASTIYDALGEIRPDVIDFQYRWAPDYTMAMDRAMRDEVGMVFTFHNVFGEGEGILRPISYVNDSAISIHLKKYDRILCVSEFVKRDLIARGFPPERICVVPNGIDPNVTAGVSIRDDGFGLYLGRLVRTKSIHTLIHALSILKRKGVRVPFKIAGDGPQKDRLIAQAKRLGLDDLEFLGRVSDAEKWRLYARCSYFVLPSLFESFGMVLLEAMLFRKPVISTRVGGIPEVVGDAGLLVPPEDPDALADAIAYLSADQQARSALSATAERQARAFTWDKVCESVEEVYLRSLESLVRRRYAYDTTRLRQIITSTAARDA